MSTKSGVAEQVISVPSGGGAIQGLGETFSPDLFTGTGKFSIPITLPAGRNGFQPSLALVYSSGNGMGPFGLGWSLSVPGVSRRTPKGVPVYDDAKDVFVLSGAEELTPLTELPGRYRARTEGLFARVEHHGARSETTGACSRRTGFAASTSPAGPAGASSESQRTRHPLMNRADSDTLKEFHLGRLVRRWGWPCRRSQSAPGWGQSAWSTRHEVGPVSSTPPTNTRATDGAPSRRPSTGGAE